MVCTNCGKETKGIKLNGKIFCSFCGEIIKDPTEILEEAYLHSPKNKETAASPKESPKNSIPEEMIPRILRPDYEDEATARKEPGKEEVQLLEAEEEIIDLISKKSSTNKAVKRAGNKTIRKHDRARTDARNFELIPNEPDPIAQPELEAPTDSLISDHEEEPEVKPEKETGHMSEVEPRPMDLTQNIPKEQKPIASVVKDREKSPDESKRKRQEIFTDYLRQTSGVSQSKNNRKKKKKTKKRKSHKLLWTFVILFIFIIGAGFLIYYANNVATDQSKIVKDLEANTSFNYNEPTGIPAGYELSYLSEKGENYIKYHYTFIGNRDKYVSVRIEPTEIKSEDIFESIIKELKTGYSMTREGGLEFWLTEDHKIFVIKDNVLYSFDQSGELFDEIIMNFALETIL